MQLVEPHIVPSGSLTSAGQLALAPSQVSATSHAPASARQSVPAPATASDGQLALEPEHASATSHAPLAPRQTVLALA